MPWCHELKNEQVQQSKGKQQPLTERLAQPRLQIMKGALAMENQFTQLTVKTESVKRHLWMLNLEDILMRSSDIW